MTDGSNGVNGDHLRAFIERWAPILISPEYEVSSLGNIRRKQIYGKAPRVAHGTDIRGSDVSLSVLEEDQIPVIRSLIVQHVPHVVIAKAFNVSPSTISLIGKGEIWRHA